MMLLQMDNFDPCSDYYVNAYLNDPAVQSALHANVTRLDHPWSACRYTRPSVHTPTSYYTPKKFQNRPV
jgi:hypothetical protein